MGINDRKKHHALASRMARHQVEMFLAPTAAHNPKDDVHHATVLIDDLVHRLGESALAVEFAFQFHRKVEVWNDWGAWEGVLDMLLALEHQDPSTHIRLHIFMSRTKRGLRKYHDAEHYAKSAYAQATNIANIPLVAKSLNQLAAFAFELDDFDQARLYLDEAIACDDSDIPDVDLGHIYIKSGHVAVQQARFLDAHVYFEKAAHHYEHAQDRLFVTMVQANQADLLSREGKFDQAIATLQHTLQRFQHDGARYDYAMALNSLGCMYIQMSKWDDAEIAFSRSLKILNDLGTLSARAWVLTNLIELYVKTCKTKKVEEASQEAYALAETCNKPLVTAGVHVDYGQMLYNQGKYKRAHQLWTEALAIQERFGAKNLAKHTRNLLSNVPPEYL